MVPGAHDRRRTPNGVVWGGVASRLRGQAKYLNHTGQFPALALFLSQLVLPGLFGGAEHQELLGEELRFAGGLEPPWRHSVLAASKASLLYRAPQQA